MKYPPPEDLPLAVVESTDANLVFVQSREYAVGAFWPVEKQHLAWRCPCPGYQRRHTCVHTDAARAHKPRLALVEVPVHEPDDASLWQYARDMYQPGGA